jgi:Fe2+ transport system protein FeoA
VFDRSSTPSDSAPSRSGAPAHSRLDDVPEGVAVEVVVVDGEDAISERLAASGIWQGAVIERVATAPFGDPMLFRIHGYRLALRRSEASRICVTECAG